MNCPFCEAGIKAKRRSTRNVIQRACKHVQQLTLTVGQWWRIDMKSFLAALKERLTEFEAVKDVSRSPLLLEAGQL